MCGMSGAAGSMWMPEKKGVEYLMLMNIVRGPHSTGLASIPRSEKDDPLVLKALGTPYGDPDTGRPGIMGLKSWDKAFSGNPVALISHNRWATRGEVTSKNAHPFYFDNVIGTHNGTLFPSSEKRLLGHGVHQTDSECIFNTINEKGIEKTVPLLEGAYALVWYDLTKNTINMIRNNQRPLHYVFSENGQTMFWSSDALPLIYALDQAKVAVGSNKVNVLTADTWMEWEIPPVNKPFGTAKRMKIEGYVSPPVDTRSWRERQGGSQYDGSGGTTSNWNTGGSEAPKFPLARAGVIGTDPSGRTPRVISRSVDPVNSDPLEDKIIDLFANDKNKGTDSSVRKSMVDRVREVREQKFSEQFPIELEAIKAMNLIHRVSKSDTVKIFRDYKRDRWIWFKYDSLLGKWEKFDHEIPPVGYMAFTAIDVESGGSHLFSYQKRGKGKRRTRHILYKGYQGNLLAEGVFNELMADGCASCQSTPVWGNAVRFISPTAFLCEHCSSSPRILGWMGIPAVK